MNAKLLGNGVDAVSGGYLSQDVTAADIVNAALRREPDPALPDINLRRAESEAHLGIRHRLDANDLADAGWGVIFACNADPAIREVLSPLLELRREQANRKKSLYKEFIGRQGYLPGLEKNQFIVDNNAAPGRVDPCKIPYYLLLVGGPDAIPYEFQYLLDVAYAVGRICFDSLEEYAAYARSVVAAEKGLLRRNRQATFFGVCNPDDGATALSTQDLVIPLASRLEKTCGPSWNITRILAEDALKSRLMALVGGEEKPALLFTASHGIGFPSGHLRQPCHQGALLCGDWPGPVEHVGPIPQDYYFSRDDVPANADLAGLVSFHFACYGAGTPQYDGFSQSPARMLAPSPMLAPLAKRLLGHGHKQGGALAFIGHVDRAWGYSFLWPGTTDAQTQVFEDALSNLFDGCTVGFAMEAFNEKFAEMATTLIEDFRKIRAGRKRDDLQLAANWTVYSDARNYVIIGDPAVRLAVASNKSA